MHLPQILRAEFYRKINVKTFSELEGKFVEFSLKYGPSHRDALWQAFICDYAIVPPQWNEELEVVDIFAIHFLTRGVLMMNTPAFDVYLKHDRSLHIHVFTPDIKERPYVNARVKINGVELGTFPLLNKVTN